MVEAFVHSDTGCHIIGCVFLRRSATSNPLHCFKGIFLPENTMRETPSQVQKYSSSVVKLPLLVDWRRGRYEQGLRRDVRFER